MVSSMTFVGAGIQLLYISERERLQEQLTSIYNRVWEFRS
jgi:hypothetical protein